MIIGVFFKYCMTLMSFLMANTKNPVKMSMMLTIFSSFMFIGMYSLSGSTWFPILFFLIFMGGILMMFMILSSILPNEKNKKSFKYIFIAPFLTIFMYSNPQIQELMEMGKYIKTSLDSSSTVMVMMILMLWYFFISILMVSKEESPMRKSLC